MRTEREDRPDRQISAGKLPIDFAILRALPAEGTKLSEFVPLAARAVRVTNQLGGRQNGVTSSMISGRLRVMHLVGLVVQVTVQPVGSGMGWQRTAKGDALLAEQDADASANGQEPQIEEADEDE